MRILLTGAKGQVGRCLKEQRPEVWEMIAADSRTLDITNPQSIANMLANFEPDVIINAAGYTDLDAAEGNPEQVFAVNASGVANLARAAGERGIRLIHISSDYVFDGKGGRPYTETDYPNPASTYARSKLAGELLALSLNPKTVIVRSSWVFSEYGDNFVRDIIRLAAEKGSLSVVTDKTGCPTYAGDLARFMIELAADERIGGGIYHFCGDVPVSRYEFAQVILHQLNKIRPDEIPVAAVQSADEQTPRPAYSVLCCDKIRSLGYAPSDWQAALKHVVPLLAGR